MFDKLSKLDISSKLDSTQARKLLSEILSKSPSFVWMTAHCKSQMQKRGMIATDVVNVLLGGKIHRAPEYENGQWRYRVETGMMTVVIAFEGPSLVCCVTAWRNKK